MKTPILTASYLARSTNAAADRCVNLFLEAVPQGGKEPSFLSRCPGLRRLTTAGSGPIRGVHPFGDYLYAVSDTSLYRVDKTWTVTLLGYVSGVGPVSMADNGLQLFVACNGPSYIWDTNANILLPITDPDFPGAVTVAYLDGYFLFNEPNSQKFWVTSILGTEIDPLDFASAEGSPDNLVAVRADHREAWLFGTNSIEVWYNAGGADFPFARISGAFIEIGCQAPYSIVKLDNSLFWLGSDGRGTGIVYRANGYTGVRVSTHAIEFAIASYGDVSDALGYSYQQEGHSFYVLIFPTAQKTWCFDAATGLWHERAGFHNGVFTRHHSNCGVSFNNEIVVGDFDTGNLYAFDLDVHSDDDNPQKWLKTWRALPTGQNNLKRTAHHSLQLDCEAGVGLDGAVQGTDPQVSLRWSDDGGHTWSNYHQRGLGLIGQTGRRVIWRRLGMTNKLRDRVLEVSGTDPVKIAIMGAELILTPTAS